MTRAARKQHHPRREKAKPASAEPPSTPVNGDPTVYERPNGWYWAAPDGHQEFGPFDSRGTARADRDRFDEQAPAEGETLREAEQEIGIADWIDAETGEPAEGQSPPHFEEP
jgi:hypothetical protein